MTKTEREDRGISAPRACLTIDGAIRLVALWEYMGRVAWWRIEEGTVNVYWSLNVPKRKR